MIIPVDQLEKDTLLNLVQAYVLQEGTDYGEHEISMQNKVEQVIQQLNSGEAVLLYSELHESVNIVSKQHYQTLLAQGTDSDYSG